MNANKTIISLVVAALGHADNYVASVAKLRAAVIKDGVDVTDVKAVRQALMHGVAAKRGMRVEVAKTKDGNDVASGKLTLQHKDENKVKAGLMDLSRLSRAVVGETSKSVEEIAITRAMKTAAKTLIAACGSKKAAMAAIKAA